MKSILTSVIAMFLALLSILFLLLFYSHQNEFTNSYKEVLSEFHTLESTEQKLTYGILQNVIYIYNNQDPIAKNRNTFVKSLQKLHSNTLLQEKNYVDILRDIDALERKKEDYFYQLDTFLTLNAGIKNSFIYISTHAYDAIISEKHPPEYIRISQYISKAFITASHTLDADILKKTQNEIHKLEKYNQSLEKPSRAIGLFLLHVRFISDNFPPYTNTLNYLLASPLLNDITKIQEDFTDIATKDISALNRFAILLISMFILSIIFISALLLHIRRENRKLEKMTDELNISLLYDRLTGLKNRFSFEKELKNFKKPTLVLFNIDSFKHVNDFYGTEVGDFVLKECADILKSLSRDRYSAQIFRLGGDDFGIVLEDITIDKAHKHTQNIIDFINNHLFSTGNLEINVTLSVAISNQTPLIENADMALKHIKVLSDKHIITYSDELGLKEAVANNIEMTNILKAAILSDRVVPYFQPIYHLEHKSIEKYEALVRINCLNGDILQPWQFLPTAVKTAYYSDITRIMLEKSMAYFKDLPYRFSINLAMQDLKNETLIKIIKDTLKKDMQTAKRLDIELLESEHINEIDLVNDFIRDIKHFGCRVSIDDFGSGYSNFSYLSLLNIDILKIDGSLIKKVHTDHKSYQIVKTIVDLAQINNLEVVAEFVENGAIAECLQTLGVTYAQGYHYGKPQNNTL